MKTSKLKRSKVSELVSINFCSSISSLSITETRSSSLFANSSVPEISPRFSKRLSIIEMDFSKFLLSIVFLNSFISGEVLLIFHYHL